MLKRLLLPALALGVAASLLLSGCGGPGGSEKLDPEKSPLNEYMSRVYGMHDEKRAAADQKKTEELIATCMADEGFEYTPVDQSQYTSFSSADSEERDTEKWVAEHGWGMIQTPEEMEAASEGAEEFVDPNGPYVQSLSESEQGAYYETLYGVGPTEEEMESDTFVYDWTTGGCQGAAQHELRPDPNSDEKHKPLMDDINKMYEKSQKNPALAKLDSEWAACMADAGFTGYKKRMDAQQVFSDELNAYYESTADGPDEAALAKLRETEIETALADFTCAKAADYQDRSLKAQFEFETQFVNDHKSELDALVADYEQGK